MTSKVRNRESTRLGERVEGVVVVEGYGEGLKLFNLVVWESRGFRLSVVRGLAAL